MVILGLEHMSLGTLLSGTALCKPNIYILYTVQYMSMYINQWSTSRRTRDCYSLLVFIKLPKTWTISPIILSLLKPPSLISWCSRPELDSDRSAGTLKWKSLRAPNEIASLCQGERFVFVEFLFFTKVRRMRSAPSWAAFCHTLFMASPLQMRTAKVWTIYIRFKDTK